MSTTTVTGDERRRRLRELGFSEMGGWLVRDGCRAVINGDDLTLYFKARWSARLSGDAPWQAVVANLRVAGLVSAGGILDASPRGDRDG